MTFIGGPADGLVVRSGDLPIFTFFVRVAVNHCRIVPNSANIVEPVVCYGRPAGSDEYRVIPNQPSTEDMATAERWNLWRANQETILIFGPRKL